MGSLKELFEGKKCYDVSITLSASVEGPNCFYAPLFETSPVVAGCYVGDTRKGGSVNFFNVKINPHGNGTHTECVGHIAVERVSIHAVLKHSFFNARLVTLYPTRAENGDRVILASQIEEALADYDGEEALLVRTMPNEIEKQRRLYSGTNPPYFHHEAIRFLVEKGVVHLLTDLPSVDREEDGGQLLAHKTFWNYPDKPAYDRTITELIYVADEIKDGKYYINIQIPPFELDAAPSRVLLYEI